MNPTACLASALFVSGLVLAPSLQAQTPRVHFPAASPACTLKQRVGLTDIQIQYSRPGVKGRKIYGGLLPFGRVWRTGANASTKVSFSTPVKLDGHEVPAGKYALYTIPGENEWTIILSKNTKLWGAFGYKPDDDLLRFSVEPVALPSSVETFTIGLADIRDDSATLYLDWEKTRVPIRLTVDVAGKVVPEIEAAMESSGKKSAGFYFQAANFYYNHGQDLKKALAWLNAGLAQKPGIAFELLHLKAKILAKQGDKEGAIAAAKKSTELSIKAEGPGNSFVWMNRDLISSLQRNP